MKFISHTACASVVALTFCAGYATAQTQTASTSTSTDTGSDETLVQKRVLVTARKVEEDIQDIPVAVTALSGEELVDANVSNMMDLAKYVPSVEIYQGTGEQSAVTFSVRGQSQADILLTTDSSVGTYIDGVNVPRTFGLTPGLIDIQRVEVLKGPQGTLYGRNTTGGAVSLYTRAPDLSAPGGYVTGKVGNYALADFHGALNLPLIKDKLGVRLVARNTDRDGYGEDGAGRPLSEDNSEYFRGRLLWTPTPDFTADFTADYTNIDVGGPSSRILSLNGFPPRPDLTAPTSALYDIAAEAGLLTFDPTDPANQGLLLAAFAQAQALWEQSLPGNFSGDFYDHNGTFPTSSAVEMSSYALNLSYDLTDEWMIKSTTGYRQLDRLTAEDLDMTPYVLLHPTLFMNSEFFSEELQLSYTGERLDAIFGGFYSNEEGRDGSTTFALGAINPTNPNRQDGSVKNESIAAYAQFGYALTDRLDLTAGLRWTEETKGIVSRNSRGPDDAIECTIPAELLDTPGVCIASLEDKFSDWSYLLSLDYQLSDNILVYAKTARGFRGGGQNLRGSGNAASFDPFDPETVTDYEIGLKAESPDGRFRLNTAAYTTDYKDIQRTIVFTLPGGTAVVSNVQNAAAATISGFEAEAWYSVTDRFDVKGTVGYIDAGYDEFSDATGDRTDEAFAVPEWTYSLGARYTHPTSFGSVVANVDYSWRDDVIMRSTAFYDADVTQEAYGLLGARLAFNLDKWDASVAIFGTNLTDEEYLASAVDLEGSLGWNVGFVGAPMTYGIEFTKRFGGG